MSRPDRRGRPRSQPPVVDEALGRLDAAIGGLCACGCRQELSADGPSAWFASAQCQRNYHSRHTDRPDDVYGRPDAAMVYPQEDARQVPLHPGSGLEQLERQREADERERILRGRREQIDRLPRPTTPPPSAAYSFDPQAFMRGSWLDGALADMLARLRGQEIAVPPLLPQTVRALFIDGPLAGRVIVLDRGDHRYVAPRRQAVVEPITANDLLLDRPPAMDYVVYEPVGNYALHHDPQPWTCSGRPSSEAEYNRMLALAWYHLHGPQVRP